MGFEPQTASRSVYQGRLAVSGLDAGKQVFNGFSVDRKIMYLGLAAVSSPSPHRNHAILVRIFPPSFPRLPALAPTGSVTSVPWRLFGAGTEYSLTV